ncbi:MAG: DUF1015 domain-containing protein [Nannocystaceae bacterium]
MVAIRPFRGLRFDTPRVGEARDLLAPPYDVIDDAHRAELVGRSALNCARLILPEGEGDARYPEGRRVFDELRERALVLDETPSLYVYHQAFEVGGERFVRKGLICAMELTSFGEGEVRPHERTLAGPKADRLKLMRACDGHLELVFGMFSDPDKTWEAALGEGLGEPVLDDDFDGAHHTLYRVSDPAICAAVQAALAERAVYIADGHHRYETMCAFRDELVEAGRPEAAKMGMIYLSNLDDEGLVVLPTHRIVHGLEAVDLPALLERAGDHFEISTRPLPTTAAALSDALDPGEAGRATFGLTLPGSGSLAVLRLRADFDPNAAGLGALHPSLATLDVALLHELILERGLGISKAAQAAKTNLKYYKSTEASLETAASDGGKAQLVCFMNATPVQDVVAVCDSGQVMPQKSTFFYPKIPTGLVFRALSDDEG